MQVNRRSIYFDLSSYKMARIGDEEDFSTVKDFDKALHNFAVGTVTLPSLETLELDGVHLKTSFYRGLNTGGPHSRVRNAISLFNIMKCRPTHGIMCHFMDYKSESVS